MRGKSIFLVVLCVMSLGVSPGAVLAQSNVTTGSLLGTVLDGEGLVLPGVSVEARNTGTGLLRRAITDERGGYRFEFVPVGVYDVRAELDGFRPEIRQGIGVNLGSSVKLDLVLSIGTVAEELVVTATAPVVETTRPDVAGAVGTTQIANLPLNGRDFLDFIALTPQSVTDDNGASHIGGMRGVQNSFSIDGANGQSNFFGQERGTTRAPFTFSQAAIREFQVIPSSYNVQFGNASGGIINAITKSGTNELKSEAWFYLRNEAMVDNDAFDREPGEFDQKQFGAALGGPVVKDRLHFFVSYDGQRKDRPVFRKFVNFPAGREGDYERLTGLDFAAEQGGNQTGTDDNDVFLGKLDWQVSSKHLATVRYNNSDYDGANGTDVRYPETAESNNGFENGDFFSVVASFNSVLTDSAFNEAIVQYSDEARPRIPNTTLIPEVQIRGFQGTFGQRNYLPNDLIETHRQIKDNVTFFAGGHTIKAGVDLDQVKYDNWFPRYASGQYSYSTWADFLDGRRPYSFQQAFYTNGGHAKFDVDYYAGYLQDEWRPIPNLTLTFGLRYDLQDNPTPEVSNPLYPATASVPDDKDNWAPRVGFAWDPFGSGRTVVRGGYGYFYDGTPMILLANALLNNGVTGARYYMRCSSTVTCPGFPTILTSPGQLNADKPTIYVFDEEFEHARTKRASLGIEQQLGSDLSVGGDFIYSETDHLERIYDANLIPVGYTPYGGYLFDSRRVKNSNFSSIAQFTSDGWGEYWAVVLKGRKRFADKWMFDASYTYSKAKDTNSNEVTVSLGGYGSGEDPLNPAGDWAYADHDVRHKFVASAVVMLPWDFQVASIVTVRSGMPFSGTSDICWNAVAGSTSYSCYDPGLVDYRPYVDGEHYERNTFRQPWYRNVDLRISKVFRIGKLETEIIAEAFNLLGTDNLYTSNKRLQTWSSSTNTTALDPNFNTKNLAYAQRQYQLGLKFRY